MHVVTGHVALFPIHVVIVEWIVAVRDLRAAVTSLERAEQLLVDSPAFSFGRLSRCDDRRRPLLGALLIAVAFAVALFLEKIKRAAVLIRNVLAVLGALDA